MSSRPICLAVASLQNLSSPSAATSNNTSLPEDATPDKTTAFRLISAPAPVRQDGGGSPVLCCFCWQLSHGLGIFWRRRTPQLTALHCARKCRKPFQKSPPKRRDEHGAPKLWEKHGVWKQQTKGFWEFKKFFPAHVFWEGLQTPRPFSLSNWKGHCSKVGTLCLLACIAVAWVSYTL